MNAKAYFQTHAEAKTFFDSQKGGKSIGSVRKDLRSELGNWVVQYTEKTTSETIEVGSKVTMVNTLPETWFKVNRSKAYPVNLTGVVTKVFKNGRVALRVKELDNKSMNYPMSDLTLI